MDYLKWKDSYVRNRATVKAYEVWINRLNTFIDKPPIEITLGDITEFRDSLRDRYAPKNIQYGMTIIHDYLKFQMAHGLQFPIALFKVKAERANSHYPITEKEYLKLLDSLQPQSPRDLRNLVMIRILWETGIRAGELVSMKMLNMGKCGCRINTEKNIYERNIYWSFETDELLRFYLKQRRNLKTDSPNIFVSMSRNGSGSLSVRSVERMLEEILRERRMNKKIVPHSFRHAFVHRQILRGVSEPVVANMVGHTSTNTIMTYSKLSSRELAKAWRQILSPIRVRESVRLG